MTNLTCEHCGASPFGTRLWGCKEPNRPCGLPPFDAYAYAHRYDCMKNSPEFLKRMQEIDWDKAFKKQE